MFNFSKSIGLVLILVSCAFGSESNSVSQVSDVEYAPIVQLRSGKVRGLVEKVGDDDVKVYSYQGIRYGKAKRFDKPYEADSWGGVYNATKYRDACPQEGKQVHNAPVLPFETLSMSEDCLYVNVWQPAANTNKSRSVMVWIHGGSFKSGTIFSVIYDGRFIAAIGDVVVVSVNYRLGPFGFLYAGEDYGAAGNQGLYDQVLALRWVRDNIRQFGGDPNEVTVFGESAGSMSVGSLVLSPYSKGLFKRAIMQSGAPNSYLGSIEKEKALPKTKSLAERLGCPSENMGAAVDCLRSKSIESILFASKDALANGELMFPVYGEKLMPYSPVTALKSGKFNNVDLMFGVNRNEGSSFVAELLPIMNPDTKHPNITIDTVKSAIGLMMMMFGETHIKEVTDFYTKNLNASNVDELRMAISNVFGDYHLVCPTILYGEQFAQTAAAKHHFYSYRLMKPLSTISVLKCRGWMGVCHAEDVVYLFGLPMRLLGVAFTKEEAKLSNDMINSWTTFAKTGQINPIDNVKWTEAIDKNQTNPTATYMSLDPSNYTMVSNYFKEVCDGLWKPKIFV